MESFDQVIAQTWWLGIPSAFFVGLLLAVNPAAFPMLGTVLAVGSTGELGAKGAGVRMVAAFGAGMAVVYAGVGMMAGQVDRVLTSFLAPYSGIGYVVLGTVLVAVAAFVLLRPSRFCSACALPAPRSPTMLGAFLAGIPGGLVNCPACAGIVLGVASSAATIGNVAYSTLVILALGAGHAAMLAAITWWVIGKRALPTQAVTVLRPVTAVVLVGIAAYFFWLAGVNGLNPTQPRLV